MSTISFDSLPPGTLYPWSGPVPAGWLPCDGRALPRFKFPALHRAVGNTYGDAGVLDFKIPDMRGRYPENGEWTESHKYIIKT